MDYIAMLDYIFNSVSCKSFNVLKKLIKVNDSFLFGKLLKIHLHGFYES